MRQIAGKATKKPIEINWFKWEGYSVPHLKELMIWVQSFGGSFHEMAEFGPGAGDLRIKTLEGTSYSLPDGFYIIRGVKGEFYPCEPEVFVNTYEIHLNLFD